MEILRYDTELQAQELIGQINLCLGLPNGQGTDTWAKIMHYCKNSGTTEYGYTVIIKDECLPCLTDLQKTQIVNLPDDCGECL